MTPEDVRALAALGEEKGGQVLLQVLQNSMEANRVRWLRLIESNKHLPDPQDLRAIQLKYQAELEAYGQIVGWLTGPKESPDG